MSFLLTRQVNGERTGSMHMLPQACFFNSYPTTQSVVIGTICRWSACPGRYTSTKGSVLIRRGVYCYLLRLVSPGAQRPIESVLQHQKSSRCGTCSRYVIRSTHNADACKCRLIHSLTDAALMYFAQNGTYLGPKPGTSPTGPTSAVGFNENATLPFQPGKTYRLRIVNVSAFAAFFFWIDGHDMRIIEVDGVRF